MPPVKLPTTYLSESSGKEVEITEMNHYHLVSALVKTAIANANPQLIMALKQEVIARLER